MPFNKHFFENHTLMNNPSVFDVIIIGGSYAGLSAAMALGRSLRHVLVIDSGQPCNKQTPHSHNFITQDGQTPGQIVKIAKEQVLKYKTVKFQNGVVISAEKIEKGFEISTQSGEQFIARKLLFATGVQDQMPSLPGFAACWGISILHCPYCHGYEVKDTKIGLMGNGDVGFGFCQLLNNWSKNLILFTNGPSTLTSEQTAKLTNHGIQIIENDILEFEHQDGSLQNIVFMDNSRYSISTLFARVSFKQHCDIPQEMGCELTEQGYIKVDDFHQTSVSGVFAAGDNTSMLRAVSAAVASGTKAGAFINKELIEEEF